MKIKTKKKVTARELINLYLDGKIEGGKYINKEDNFVGFADFVGSKWCEVSKKINLDELFEVKIEQEIDENTEIESLVELYSTAYGERTCFYETPRTIKDVKDTSRTAGFKTLAFYIMQDDMTMQLIWKDGEFVD